MFTRVDFVDQESNTRILTLVSIGVNTNVEDLCGETVGTKMRRRRKSKISITSSLSIAPQANNIVEVSENLLDKNEFLESQMKKKHVFVKKLLQGMSQVTDH